MVEELLIPAGIGLASYLGKKLIDRWFDSSKKQNNAVIASGDQFGYTTMQQGRTHVGGFSAPRFVESEVVVGDFYVPYSVNDYLTGSEITLVLVIEEFQQQAYLFGADLDSGYEIELPHGYYTFLVLFIDGDEEDIDDAEILAVGFPSSVDLSEVGEISVEDHDEIFELIESDPLLVTSGGPFYMDFIFLDTDDVPELPQFFSELL